MKAVAVWPSSRKVGVVEQAAPTLDSDTSVRLRVLDVGVCGTDAEICRFDYGGTPPAGEDHLVVGHEALGQVIELGSRVSRLRPGDLVAPMVRRPCSHPECSACRAGHPDFCETGAYLERGIVGAHGFLAEQVVENERYLVPLAREIRDVGVLTEPLTIAEKGLRQFLEVRRRLPWLERATDDELMAGRHALVLGAGPVGLLGCMLLRLRGFSVTVYSRGPSGSHRAGLVEKLGAAYLSSSETTAAEAANLGVDLCLCMSIEPGYSGQKFMPEALGRLERLRSLVDCLVQVDGGITHENAGAAHEAGADLLVAGTSIFGADDIAHAYRGLVQAVA